MTRIPIDLKLNPGPIMSLVGFIPSAFLLIRKQNFALLRRGSWLILQSRLQFHQSNNGYIGSILHSDRDHPQCVRWYNTPCILIDNCIPYHFQVQLNDSSQK